MSSRLAHNSSRIYQIVVTIWLVIFAAVILLIIASDIQRAKAIFNDYANADFQQANDRVHINETVLEGFAAMISAANDLESTRIRVYARQMLKQYPHIYMFEIVEKVSHDKLEQFIDYYRRTFYRGFEVKGFSYESDRQWQPVKNVPYHLPIVFMEPFPVESRKVLGLDVSSNEFFMLSLRKSAQQGRVVSTNPFKLVEGDQAYVLHRPIPESESGDISPNRKSGAQGGFALLVIRADTLLDKGYRILPGMQEFLYNPAFALTDPRGRLYRHEQMDSTLLEAALFPRLHTSRSLDSESQPFVLVAEQQLGWRIISWGKLVLTLLIAVITFAVMVVYARLYFRNEMERKEITARLFFIANHDPLTGLANRNLLYDRLNHAIAQADRRKGRLAVLFLDLEDFKKVNDTFGHDTGDGLLKNASERLRTHVRAGDTIARLGGDEFVLVLENITGKSGIDHVIKQIRAGFERPFSVNARSVQLGISIGRAIYPQDGTDIETLIGCADASMYEDKRSRA